MALHCQTTMSVVILTLFCWLTLSADNDRPCGAGVNTRPILSAKNQLASSVVILTLLFVGQHVGLCVRGVDTVSRQTISYFWLMSNCKNCSSKCAYDCTASVHNTTQNSSDNLPSYLQTNIIAQMLSVGGEKGVPEMKVRILRDGSDQNRQLEVTFTAGIKHTIT